MEECPVCFEKIKLQTLHCKHQLCSCCIKKIKEFYSVKCPICRTVCTPPSNSLNEFFLSIIYFIMQFRFPKLSPIKLYILLFIMIHYFPRVYDETMFCYDFGLIKFCSF